LDFSLCRSLAIQQAALFNGLGFDLLSPIEDGFVPAEIDIGRRKVAEALVIAMLVVVALLDKSIV
jgi:hypothetical protein